MDVYGAKELADSFRTVRKNTLIIAEEIPEEKYSYKAAPEVMSVGEMLAHLAVNTDWVTKLHGPGGPSHVEFGMFAASMAEAGEAQKRLATKSQIVDALRRNGDAFAAFLEGVTSETLRERVTFPAAVGAPNGKSRFEMILSTKEHEMHHRAQLMLMQRLLGMVPHLTRERQQRMAQAAAPARS